MKPGKKDENVESVLSGISSLTYRIHIEGEKTHSMASGFFWHPVPGGPLVFITAGHKVEDNEILINTRLTNEEGNPLLVSIGKFKVFNSEEDGDFAFCILKSEEHKKLIENFPELGFYGYLGKFPEPKKDEVFSFAVDNNNHNDFVKIDKETTVLYRYWCYEAWMVYECDLGHFHHLGLSRDHQGHDYYQGASGSPIVNDDGLICGILIGPSNETKNLGLRMMNMATIELAVKKEMETLKKEN